MRDKLPAEATPATVLVTGSAGFISGYLVQELLDRGHKVLGVDNFSKYGPVERSYQSHPNYKFVEGDAKDVRLLTELALQCDHVLAAAARIGGISYFHAYAYDLIAENERILAATFDAAIRAFREGHLKKITVLSSSMVFENATVFPTPEEHVKVCPLLPARTASRSWRPNTLPRGRTNNTDCPTRFAVRSIVSASASAALGDRDIASGNVKLAMSHVVPDLVQKVLKGQDPLRILGDGNQVRCYTYGGDLARGICTAMFHPAALNDDFNLSTPKSTTVLELAELIWHKVRAALRIPKAVPLRVGRALHVRRAASRAGREQGRAGPRFSGRDVARDGTE